MEILASALVSVRIAHGKASALIRVTASGEIVWRRYLLELPVTSAAIQDAVTAASRHLVPHGGKVQVHYQLPLLPEQRDGDSCADSS